MWGEYPHCTSCRSTGREEEEAAPARAPPAAVREAMRALERVTVGGGWAAMAVGGRVMGRVVRGGKQGFRGGMSLMGAFPTPLLLLSRDRRATVTVMAGPQ